MEQKQTYKVLAILRASTIRQEIESQKEEVRDFLLSKGFAENEIDYIEAKGASARKANQEYIDFINEIKSRILNNPNIRTVGCWHLNRLGRIKKHLTDLENFFVTNQIQMYVKNGFDMPLLDKNGKETIGASIAFSVYSAMVENETVEMMEKMKRGKERNEREGKYNGGKIKLGYVLNSEKRFEIDPDKADIVRKIFSMFIEEGLSTNKIYHHFADLGIFKPSNNLQVGSKVIIRILKDTAYIGEGLYPAIVSPETQQKALEKIALFPKRHTPSNIYFCRGLLKDTTTNATFTAVRATVVYHIRYVDHCIGLNINAMDYACWFTASYLKTVYDKNTTEANKTEYTQKIQENLIKISNKRNRIEELNAEIERAINNNIKHPKHFSTEKMDAVISSCEKQIEAIEEEITGLETDNFRMNQFLSEKQTKKSLLSVKEGEMTDSMKKEIIDTLIEKILVTKIEKGVYRIQFINKFGYIDNSYWNYRFIGHKITLEYVDARGYVLDLTETFQRNKRFIRKRQDGSENPHKCVFQYDESMNFIAKYDTAKQASKTLHIDYKYLKDRRDTNKLCKGFYFFTTPQN